MKTWLDDLRSWWAFGMRLCGVRVTFRDYHRWCERGRQGWDLPHPASKEWSR